MNCNCLEQKKNEIKELMERRLRKPIDSVECKLYGFKLTATSSGIALQIQRLLHMPYRGVEVLEKQVHALALSSN